MRTTDPRALCEEEQPKQHCVLPTVSSGLTALLVPAVIYGVEVLGVGGGHQRRPSVEIRIYSLAHTLQELEGTKCNYKALSPNK